MDLTEMSYHHGIPIRPTVVSLTAVHHAASTSPQTVEDTITAAHPPSSDMPVPDIVGVGPSRSRRPRKERCQNWEVSETLVLIHAKRTQHFEEKHTIDKRDLMTPDVTKWARVADKVMRAGFSPCVRDGQACKSKWNQLVPEYKRIADYHGRSGQNTLDFWNLSNAQRKEEGLPRQFSQEFYAAIHEWFSARPLINPVHLRDVLSPDDSNFLPHVPLRQRPLQGGSNSDSEDPIRVAESEECGGLPGHGSSLPQSPSHANIAVGTHTTHRAGRTAPFPTAFNGVPHGQTPLVLSSSENTNLLARSRQGNTGVKRKNQSAPAVIAKATRSTAALMASQMKSISDASLEVERNKVEVQKKLFEDQMHYQRERDIRLHESVILAHENARLSIQKQHEIVLCLQQLTAVLGAGLQGRPSPPEQHGSRHLQAREVSATPSIPASTADEVHAATNPPRQTRATQERRSPPLHSGEGADRHEFFDALHSNGASI